MMSHEENCGMGYEESCDQRAAFEEFIANLARGLEGEGFNVRRVNLSDLGKTPHQPPAKESAPINKQEGEAKQKGEPRRYWSVADLLTHEAELRRNGRIGKYRREEDGQLFLIEGVLSRPEFNWSPVIQDIVKTQHFIICGANNSVCFGISSDDNSVPVRFTIDGETKKIKDVVLVRDEKS